MSLLVITFVALVFTLPRLTTASRLLVLVAFVYAPMLLILPSLAVLQGVASSIVAVLTVGLMGRPALHDAVIQLPLPLVVKLLLLQILHQASVLSVETAKIRQAMVVRGAIPHGRSRWKILQALPRVWIPRVIFKANRVAHALELRGYGSPLPRSRPQRWKATDVLYAAVGGAMLIGTICLRFIP